MSRAQDSGLEQAAYDKGQEASERKKQMTSQEKAERKDLAAGKIKPCVYGGEGEDVSVSEGCLGLLRAGGGRTTDPSGVHRI